MMLALGKSNEEGTSIARRALVLRDYVDFEWSLDENTMRIYADEAGTPELVAAFLQQYLEKFQPKGSLWFSWAYTCSKMRAGEFGGGAAFVTAKRIDFVDTALWAEEQAEKLAVRTSSMRVPGSKRVISTGIERGFGSSSTSPSRTQR